MRSGWLLFLKNSPAIPGIIRLLLTIIPAERGYKLAEEQTLYRIDTDFLSDLPVP
jgi:hypothetical protein